MAEPRNKTLPAPPLLYDSSFLPLSNSAIMVRAVFLEGIIANWKMEEFVKKKKKVSQFCIHELIKDDINSFCSADVTLNGKCVCLSTSPPVFSPSASQANLPCWWWMVDRGSWRMRNRRLNMLLNILACKVKHTRHFLSRVSQLVYLFPHFLKVNRSKPARKCLHEFLHVCDFFIFFQLILRIF